jgi:hypothetical protein
VGPDATSWDQDGGTAPSPAANGGADGGCALAPDAGGLAVLSLLPLLLPLVLLVRTRRSRASAGAPR